MKSYDHLYQRLTKNLSFSDVSASFVMEEIKATTELPI
jgi:Lrp/AsnC family transcriptional regulator